GNVINPQDNGHSVAFYNHRLGEHGQLDWGNYANNHDEVALVYADEVMHASNSDGPLKQDLPYWLGYALAHEAALTFGLSDTAGPSPYPPGLNDNQRLLARGDVLRWNSDAGGTNNIFTRFPIPDAGGLSVNPYERLAATDGIGPKDLNGNNVPDVGYVTGTGANDLIVLTDLGVDSFSGLREVKVGVQAF